MASTQHSSVPDDAERRHPGTEHLLQFFTYDHLPPHLRAISQPCAELAAEPTSVGRPMPTVQVEIRSEDGTPVPDGEDGEIHIRSPLVMLEYWRRPEETRQSILPGRWLRTGDIGHLRDGRLTLATRKRDLILRGGENVYPVEIEQRLEQHPAVAEAAAVAAPDPERGSIVRAIVVARDREPSEELARELQDHVKETTAPYKYPRIVEFTDELPKTQSGKIRRAELRG